ncbi:PAS domain-containing sensor histidine kinase [uncultured Sanguibacteroides sp.]|uniref:sensor histidine kinase n=1 Tax=uncultured Sanguibacteroides sp. TaxID=1635151 RepID=UPI0025F4D170|nr:PAS domain-containing sensor histidine kinase [uncultured Sanguibacteroides sp.]
MCTALKHLNSNRKSDEIHCVSEGFLSDRLLNALQTSVIFFDTDGTIFRANNMARKDLHLGEDIEGQKLFDLITIMYRNDNILPELISRFNDVKTEQVALPQDSLMGMKDNKIMFFATGCISRLDCGRFLFSFRNVVDEMTQEYMIKMALGSTKIFPWFYDFERATMIIDPRYFDYTGIPTKDYTMTLEAFSERIHPDDRDSMAHALTLHFSGEHYPYPVPFRLRRGDNRYEWFEGQSTYLGQVKGMPYRIVGICMSTQAHKDIEETLTIAKNKAEQSDRLKSAFLANMSHELRTPLNAIVGFSNLLTGGEVDTNSEDAKEYAMLISKNCDHLLTLVSDILDLSRIETGAMEYSFAEHSLGKLLSDIHLNQRYAIPVGVEFNLLLPSEDIRIITDSLRLRQVVEHLIGNAVKFTAKGHIDLGYTLSSDGKAVRLFVADTGRGISIENSEKIFERFYKVDSFMQGAGLGLSICKIITERLGGTISVSSLLKKGSRFTIKLPLEP